MKTNETIETLLARQQEMEDHALALGGQRFRRKLEDAISGGSEASVGAAKKLLVEGLDKVEAALDEMIEGGKRGRPHAAVKWVKLLGTDVTAYLSLKVVLDHVHGRVTVRKAACEITDLMVDELRFRRFKEKEPRLFEYAMTSFTTSNYAHKARSLDARIHRAQIDVSDLDMSQNEAQVVGTKLLDVVIQTTGLVSVDKQSLTDEHGTTERVELVATPETLAWLDKGNAVLETLYPVNLPMIMPPLPWERGNRGGYRFALRGKHKLVRAQAKSVRAKVEAATMPVVYAALNRIQETPWRINKRIAGVLDQILLAGGGVAGLPSVHDEPLPAQPADIETNEVARKAWRRAAHAVHERNHETRSKRADLFRIQALVRLVQDEDAIWFPHNLDFRGRVYPVVSYLHPQGDDVCKALLQFADGKPLGADGARYLALHGANALGKTKDGAKLSKMTLVEREAYIRAESKAICEVASDPVGCQWWTGADDPWQFLAFCCEWAGYCEQGDNYVCALPVAQDGTCNGLQHFAGLWRDPVGGAAVNVVPQARPQDIYQRVADAVLQRLEIEASKDPLAVLWLSSGIVDRKLTKRPTMTFGYGSEQFGFANQLREYVGGLGPKVAQHFSEEVVDEKTGEVTTKSLIHPACTLMARLIWQSLEVVAVSAFNGMAWMRGCAKAISKDGKRCVEWTVPGTGLPVVQTYMVEKVLRTNTTLAGTAFRPRAWEDTDVPNWKKQASSMPPNVIHSLDAAALMLTVTSAAAEGIAHFAMVHDSYGTLPADAGLLARMTRQAFVGLYTKNDVVQDLRGQFVAQVEGVTNEDGEAIEIPEAPAKGTLDLGGVLVSEYFFS